MRHRKLQRGGSSAPRQTRRQPACQSVREACGSEPPSLEAAIEELDSCGRKFAWPSLNPVLSVQDVQQRCLAVRQQQTHPVHGGTIEGPAQQIDGANPARRTVARIDRRCMSVKPAIPRPIMRA
jgi:hypothetical protein